MNVHSLVIFNNHSFPGDFLSFIVDVMTNKNTQHDKEIVFRKAQLTLRSLEGLEC